MVNAASVFDNARMLVRGESGPVVAVRAFAPRAQAKNSPAEIAVFKSAIVTEAASGPIGRVVPAKGYALPGTWEANHAGIVGPRSASARIRVRGDRMENAEARGCAQRAPLKCRSVGSAVPRIVRVQLPVVGERGARVRIKEFALLERK